MNGFRLSDGPKCGRRYDRLVILLSFLLLALHVSSVDPQVVCNSLPFAITSMEQCSGGNCTVPTTIAITLPLSQGSAMCVTLSSPDGTGPTYTVQFSIDHANYIWNVDWSRYSDDPAMDPEGYCACPGARAVSCNVNSVVTSYNDLVACISGVHSDSSCPLAPALSGTWVAKLGMSFNPRFKTLHFNGVSKLDIGVSAVISTSDASYTYAGALIYNGISQTVATPDGRFTFSILTDTARSSYSPQYAVYDMLSPSDFYLLEGDIVNGQSEYNIGKIGWNNIQVSTFSNGLSQTGNMVVTSVLGPPPSALGISAKLIQCTTNNDITLDGIVYREGDQFQIGTSASFIADILKTRHTALSQARLPGSMLVDDDYPAVSPSGMPDHTSGEGWQALKEGIAFLVNGQPTFVGQTLDENFVPSLTNSAQLPAAFNGVNGPFGYGVVYTVGSSPWNQYNVAYNTNAQNNGVYTIANLKANNLFTNPVNFNWYSISIPSNVKTSRIALTPYSSQLAALELPLTIWSLSATAGDTRCCKTGQTVCPCDETGLFMWGFGTGTTGYSTSTNDFAPGTGAFPGATFVANHWPSYKPAEFSWWQNVTSASMSGMQPASWHIKYLDMDPTKMGYLVAPISAGAVVGTSTLKGSLKVRADVTNIVPVIDSAKTSDGEISITYHSATAGGNAYISSAPAMVFNPVPVTISTQSSTIKIQTQVAAYNGSITLYLVAGPNRAMYNLSLNFDAHINYTGSYHDFYVAVESPTNIGLSFSDAVNGALTTWQRVRAALFGVYGIAIYVLGGVCAIVILLYLVKLFRFIIPRISKFRSKSKKH